MCRNQEDCLGDIVSSSESSHDSDTDSNSGSSSVASGVEFSNKGLSKDQYQRGVANDGKLINGSLRPKYDDSVEGSDGAKTTKRPAMIGILGKWYDASNFAPHHPGGDILYEFHNRDATAQFLAYHDSRTLTDRIRLNVQGEYEYDTEKPGGSAFQGAWLKMNAKFEREGRYETPVSFLVSRVAILVAAAAGMMTMVYLYNSTRNPLAFLLAAVLMALIWQQSGFLMHDTMHNHMFHDRARDQAWGFLFGNVLVGIPGKWWRDEHSEHHIFTNTVVEGVGSADPQMKEDVWIQDEKLIPFSVQSAVSRFIMEYQQYYFIPVCLCVGLFFVKIDAMLNTSRVMDFVGITLHIGWVGAVLSCLSSSTEMIVFYVVANFFSGCLTIQLLVSHYAKPWANKEDTFQPGSWAARQVEALMDITCPRYMDWFHGGLHIHSIHHMFPRVCRCHYRDVYDDVIAMCDEHNVELDRFPWIEAIGRCITRFGTIKEKAD
jgi:fatty acid desaturase